MCHALSQYVPVTLHVYHVQCTPYKQHCCLHGVQQSLHFTVSTRESTRNNTSGACRYDTVTLGRTIWLCKLKLAHNVETKQYTVWHNMLIACSGTSLLVYIKMPTYNMYMCKMVTPKPSKHVDTRTLEMMLVVVSKYNALYIVSRFTKLFGKHFVKTLIVCIQMYVHHK